MTEAAHHLFPYGLVLVKETSPFLGEKFPWVMSNFTLHQFQHAGQLMEENGSRGLGELSEKAL